MININTITDDIVFSLFLHVLNKYSIAYLCEKMSVHRGTVKRWIKLESVPKQYFFELNKISNFKYNLKQQNKESEIRSKDQFYTKSTVAKYCWNKTLEVLKDLKINIKKYNFIEPSAGRGVFLNLLPKQKRIGIDIDPKQNNEIIKLDYLDFKPKSTNNIVVGNPPFGLRGNLALKFINHSYSFADVVAFVLPPLFKSDGKGCPSKRIKGYKLAYSEKLPLDSFEYINGKSVKIATLFQVWVKININLIKFNPPKKCDTFIKIYSLSNGKNSSSKRNINMLDKCDIYLPSTCFLGMKWYLSFDQLPNRRGYGVVFLKNKQELIKIFKENNWEKTAFYSTNSALNLRMSLIKDVVISNGFYD